MCGFTVLFGQSPDCLPKLSRLLATRERGGDNTNVVYIPEVNALVVFHRLAIVGTSGESGNQPIHKHGMYLVANGEIYNYRGLQETLSGISSRYIPHTNSDCEVILDLFDSRGTLDFVSELDGVFSFVIICPETQKMYYARDAYGVRPMYMSHNGYAISSTLQGIPPEFRERCYQVASGHCGEFTVEGSPPLPSSLCIKRWHTLDSIIQETIPRLGTGSYVDNALHNVQHALIRAVEKRFLQTERPIGCLLSGGLDSSLIAAIVVRLHIREGGVPSDIHTFSIGLKGSPDVAMARVVAKHLRTTHHEWLYEEDLFLRAIPDVIRDTGTYDITTIRASVGNWLVAKHIASSTDVRVVFNGDGADEVCGGYAYTHLAPNVHAFDADCRRLIQDIYLFDGLRSDRSIASHGLEARTPFLDKDFVKTYLSVPGELRVPGTLKGSISWGRGERQRRRMTKWFLREAFHGTGLLPDSILWRHKEAFSDGVSDHGKSWGDITKMYAYALVPRSVRDLVTPEDAERDLYHSLFTDIYGEDALCVLPYYWMPRWTGQSVTDPSARALQCYDMV